MKSLTATLALCTALSAPAAVAARPVTLNTTLNPYGGDGAYVDLAPESAVTIFLPVADPERIKARIVYDWPLEAPVEKGAQIGTLKVWIGETLNQETPLFAVNSVPVGPLHRRAFHALQELMLFWL